MCEPGKNGARAWAATKPLVDPLQDAGIISLQHPLCPRQLVLDLLQSLPGLGVTLGVALKQ